MSNTPGISPITPDIEEIRQSDADDRDLIGGEDEALADPSGGPTSSGGTDGENGASDDAAAGRPAANPG